MKPFWRRSDKTQLQSIDRQLNIFFTRINSDFAAISIVNQIIAQSPYIVGPFNKNPFFSAMQNDDSKSILKGISMKKKDNLQDCFSTALGNKPSNMPQNSNKYAYGSWKFNENINYDKGRPFILSFNFNYMFCLWLGRKGPYTNTRKSVPCFWENIGKASIALSQSLAAMLRKLAACRKLNNNRTAPFLQLK